MICFEDMLDRVVKCLVDCHAEGYATRADYEQAIIFSRFVLSYYKDYMEK